jgi:hypothetical protein
VPSRCKALNLSSSTKRKNKILSKQGIWAPVPKGKIKSYQSREGCVVWAGLTNNMSKSDCHTTVHLPSWRSGIYWASKRTPASWPFHLPALLQGHWMSGKCKYFDSVLSNIW